MCNENYIPRQDGKFLDCAKSLFAYIVELVRDWTINPVCRTRISPLIMAYVNSYAGAQCPDLGKMEIRLIRNH